MDLSALTVYLDKANYMLGYMLDIFGPGIFYVGAAFMLLHCLFGYQLLRVWSTLIGMLLGGAIGLYYGITGELTVPAMIIVTSIAAAAMGWVFYQIYLLGVFAIFGGAVYILMMIFMPDSGNTARIFASVGIGVVGILCVRPIAILLTSSLGGVLASFFYYAAQGPIDLEQIIKYGAIIAAVGVIVQFFLTAMVKDKGYEEEEEDAPIPVINLPEVAPIDKLDNDEQIHDNSLPTSDELDKMIEEQLQATRFSGIAIDEELLNDFASESAEEAAESEHIEGRAAAEELSSDIIDELIVEELPDAEIYLNKEASDSITEIIAMDTDLPEEEIGDIPAVADDIVADAEAADEAGEESLQEEFIIPDADAPNDFAISDEPISPDEAVELRSTAEIEAQIADLEQNILQDQYDKQVKEAGKRISSSLDDLQFKLLNPDSEKEDN